LKTTTPLLRAFAPSREINQATPRAARVQGVHAKARKGAGLTHPLAIRLETPNISYMRNIISILIGLFALLLLIPAFIPLLGWANWIIIPIAVVGLAIGAMSDRTSGRNLNAVVILVGVGRLMLGGGII
jgi:hypothetical protein